MQVHYVLDADGYPIESWVGDPRPGSITADSDEVADLAARKARGAGAAMRLREDKVEDEQPGKAAQVQVWLDYKEQRQNEQRGKRR